MSSILQVKDYNTNQWKHIPAIVGPKGDKGEAGDSGVYVGSEPPANQQVNVWVNPNANRLDSILSQLYFKSGDNITAHFWTAGT